jgi:aryl-alcohol dehydrogenase-like predicted oxidoreductase
VLVAQARRLGTTADALALAAVLAQPWASLVLSGAATTGQLRSNLAALQLQWDGEAAARLEEIAEPAPAYWRTRSRLPWN